MPRKTDKLAWIVAIVVIALIVAVAWYLRPGPETPVSAPPAPPVTRAKVVSPAFEHHPVPAAPATSTRLPPLPTLADSDVQVARDLDRLGNGAALAGLLIRQHLIERIVTTVDALPRSSWGGQTLPLKTPSVPFAVGSNATGPVLDESTYARYDPYMAWLDKVDVAQAVAWYTHWYPLFQQAYVELGYPHGYFNDRLVAVIRLLLATPEPAAPVRLVKTSKGYAYADPALEQLSSGQKLMLRMGPANEKRLKQKLRALLAALTQGAGPADTVSQ